MFAAQYLGRLTVIATLVFLVASTDAGRAEVAQTMHITPVKLGLKDMNNTERANLWKMVDEYATVDALQEFCGKKTGIHRRAWNAVAACVEVSSLRRVLRQFNSKKATYLKAWQDLYGEEDKKKEVCERFKTKLVEYTKIMNGQINEAANMCKNCFFC